MNFDEWWTHFGFSDVGGARAVAEAAWFASQAYEREACAKVCELTVEREADYGGRFGGYGRIVTRLDADECAALIRSRT